MHKQKQNASEAKNSNRTRTLAHETRKGLQIMVAIFVFVMLITNCSVSDEKKAQSLIKSYLKENLNNPKSYEPIRFSTLDSVFTLLEHDRDYHISKVMFDLYNEEHGEIMRELRIYSGVRGQRDVNEMALQRASAVVDSMRVMSERITRIRNEFVPQFVGWQMEHEMRATNTMNALVKSTYVFYFDKEIAKIEDVEQID